MRLPRLLLAASTLALLAWTDAVGGQREEAYRRIEAALNKAKQQRAELQVRREQAIAARGRLADDRRTAREDRHDLADSTTSAPQIDFSKYDRCPNGEAWGSCNHSEQKQEWLREQTDKTFRLQRAFERIMDDLLKRQADLQRRLEDFDRDVKMIDEASANLRMQAESIAGSIAEFKTLPDVPVDSTVRDKLQATTKVLAERADGYGRRPDGKTQCNIFAADYASSFLGRQAPELIDASTGQAALARTQLAQLVASARREDSGVRELSWGDDMQAVLRQTVDRANEGKLVLIVDATHIATVVPADRLFDSGSWKKAVPYVAQSGAKVAFPDRPIPLSEAWSASALPKLQVFVIDK